jgi:autotransporter-associated beta strand protein
MNLSGTGGNANLDTAGHTVTLSGALSGPGGLNKLGAGNAVLSGPNTYNGLTTVYAGTLELGAAAQNAIFKLGGADIRAGKIVFDYNGATSPAAAVLTALQDGYSHGFASGKLFTSTGSSAAFPGPYALGWSDDGAASGVRVQVAVYGDADLSGKVDFSDLGTVIANYGMTSGATWSQGDFNYDGTVDFSDLGTVIANYGMSLPSGLGAAPRANGAGSAVPEPGTLTMLAAGLVGLLAFAARKRKKIA